MSNDAVVCSIRKPLEETVGLSQEQAASIVARILGRPVYIANITDYSTRVRAKFTV